MSIWRSLYAAKELTTAALMDVISMGGFWVVDGQSKTGQKIEELMQNAEGRAAIQEVRAANLRSEISERLHNK